MTTPFDHVVEQIKLRGYHNQRLEDHSDLVSQGILKDLERHCRRFTRDLKAGKIKSWKNVRTPGARNRKIDLLIGEPDESGRPDLSRLRICVENKSVVTAHRNLYARFDDLNEALQVLHCAQAEAVLIATVIIGVAERVLNVPDKVKPLFRNKQREFESNVLPRLSSGDLRLWDEFPWAVSVNRPDDPKTTVKRFRELPTRSPGHTHIAGYDYVLLVPMFIDNVNPAFIPEPESPLSLGINVQNDYKRMLSNICRAYIARWHL
jgi:hypothetical protein